MKTLIMYFVAVLFIVVSVNVNADTLYWDASANADDEAMPAITYVVWQGADLDNMQEIDETSGLSYAIPEDTPYHVYYQVSAYNANNPDGDKGIKSVHIEYLNISVPLTPGGIGIRRTVTVSMTDEPYSFADVPWWMRRK